MSEEEVAAARSKREERLAGEVEALKAHADKHEEEEGLESPISPDGEELGSPVSPRGEDAGWFGGFFGS